MGFPRSLRLVLVSDIDNQFLIIREFERILFCEKKNEQKKAKGADPSPSIIWLVVSTHLKNISQNGNLPQIGVKIPKIFELPPPRS